MRISLITIMGMSKELLGTTSRRVMMLRDNRGYNQTQLEDELNRRGADIKGGYIHNIERKDALPSAKVLKILAEALQTTTDYLLMLTDDPRIPGASEPEFFSPEADEAARIIDSLPPTWRGEVVSLVRDYGESYEDVKRRAVVLEELLKSLEKHGGAMPRQLMERFIAAQGGDVFKQIDLSNPPARNVSSKIKRGTE